MVPGDTARKSASATSAMCSGSEAGSYLRLIDCCILSLRLKHLLGPVTRVKKKKKKTSAAEVNDHNSSLTTSCADWCAATGAQVRCYLLNLRSLCFGFGESLAKTSTALKSTTSNIILGVDWRLQCLQLVLAHFTKNQRQIREAN